MIRLVLVGMTLVGLTSMTVALANLRREDRRIHAGAAAEDGMTTELPRDDHEDDRDARNDRVRGAGDHGATATAGPD